MSDRFTRRRIVSPLLSVMLGIVFVLPGTALKSSASSTAVTAVQKPTEQDLREGCGQSCLYLRANENIALQALYIRNRLVTLKEMDDDEKKQALGNYCFPGVAGQEGESGEACYQRYRRMNIVALYRMRDAMIRNDHNAAQLMNRMVDVGNKPDPKNPPPVEIQISGRKPAKGQLPYVMTFDDIKKDFKYLDQGKLASKDYQEWASKLMAKPNPHDFVKFKQIYRDPDRPEAGTMMVVDRDQRGIKFDESAYRQALAYYEAHKADMARDLEGMRSRRDPLKASDPSRDGEAEADFKSARKLVVEAANGGLVKGKIPNQSTVVLNAPKLTAEEVAKKRKDARRAYRDGLRAEKGEPQVLVPPAAEGQETFSSVSLDPKALLDLIGDLQKLDDSSTQSQPSAGSRSPATDSGAPGAQDQP